MSWTNERVALLRKLWGEGKTAAEIANALGGVTRNAVIGKAHRLKLSNRVSPIQQNLKTPEPANISRKEIKPVVAKKVAVTVAKSLNVKMTDLKPRMCRWPKGDPRDADFSFCGAESADGLPYCEAHAKAAYQAPNRNRILKAEDLDRTPAAGSDEDDQKEALSA
jgi:GcrA cell cycle regulator